MTRNPHVLLAASSFYPDGHGGTEAYVAALARDLTELGYRVTVAAPADTASEYRHEGIQIHRYAEPGHVERDVAMGDHPSRGVAGFVDLVRQLRPDVVHAHSLTRGLSLHHLRAAKETGVPVVLTLHLPNLTCQLGTMMRWGREPCDGRMIPTRCAACAWHEKGLPRFAGEPLASLAHGATRVLGGRSLPGMLEHPAAIERRLVRTRDALTWLDHVVIVSEWMREPFIVNGLSTDRVTLSRQGLVGDREPRPRGDRATGGRAQLGYLGRVTEVKGLHILADALARLKPEEDVSLEIFGPCADEDRPYLTRVLEADRRIRYGGVIPPGDVSGVLGSLDALCVPSTWLETGPLVVLEAFAAGIPVLGTAAGGIAERVEHGKSGLLVANATPGAWAAALREFARLQRAGHSWTFPPVRKSSDVAREMDELYRTLPRPDPTGSGRPEG
jgi:glycosyltransferase involved in cell wall biosynthesis